jgi:hypothetical protein
LANQSKSPLTYYEREGIFPDGLFTRVEKDIDIAKNWQAGSITGPLAGRNELNFKP